MNETLDNLDEQIAQDLAPYQGRREALIAVLQKMQERFGYIPYQAVHQIAKSLKVSRSEIFGVATFYAQFRFKPPAKHNIKVCLGTACHVRGGARILETIERELGIKPGEISRDGKFYLERIACFGCCALAPVVVIDNKVYGKMTPDKVKRLITEC
jgi:NADH-quinone oxidoreductase subunit E